LVLALNTLKIPTKRWNVSDNLARGMR